VQAYGAKTVSRKHLPAAATASAKPTATATAESRIISLERVYFMREAAARNPYVAVLLVDPVEYSASDFYSVFTTEVCFL
jgi:hypothetical protein